MMSGKISDFWTPSSLPHLHLIYSIKFMKPHFLHPLFHNSLLPSDADIISGRSKSCARTCMPIRTRLYGGCTRRQCRSLQPKSSLVKSELYRSKACTHSPDTFLPPWRDVCAASWPTLTSVTSWSPRCFQPRCGSNWTMRRIRRATPASSSASRSSLGRVSSLCAVFEFSGGCCLD